MIQRSISEAVLKRAMASGADFAEIYAEDTEARSVSMIANAVDSVTTSRKIGVGIRIFSGTNSVYAYGNDLSESALYALADKVAAAAENVRGSEGLDFVLNKREFPRALPPGDLSFLRIIKGKSCGPEGDVLCRKGL